MPVSLHVDVRNDFLEALIVYLGNAALLRLYDLSAVLLSQHVCGTPFAPAPVDGVLTCNAIANATSVAAGTAVLARLYKADGTTLVLGGMTVGDSGSAAHIKLAQIGTAIGLAQVVVIDTGIITAGNP